MGPTMTRWLLSFSILTLLFHSSALERECPTGWFSCGNERCVASMWVCDGEDDCGNNMDEVDCVGRRKQETELVEEPESEVCERHQFECKTDKRCVPKTWVCDGHRDCLDGTDEDCTKNVTEVCDGFQCKDHVCIPAKWRCDESWDCSKGEDEEGCKIHVECESDEFTCNDSSTCIKEWRVCDGHNDCSHGEDEGKHCGERLCRNLSCSHDCHVEPSGARCICRSGYELASDKKTCNDIDECKVGQTCSQRCTNTKGSFLCSCNPGYDLVQNTSCQAQGDEPLLIFSTTKEIRGMWTRRQRYFPIARSRYQALGVAFDGVDRRVYWVEVLVNGGKIMSCDLDGTDVRPILSMGLQQPEDVVVDWLGRNMYITDAGLKQVLVCKLDGSYCAAIVKTDVDQPRAVAVDPKEGLLFWSDWGERPGIFRAGMDGSKRTTLVSTQVVWPNGISLDLPSRRLYWCDGKLKRFESIGLDGKDRRLILEDNNFHPFSLGVFEDTIYWSDWATYSIDACHKTTGKNQTLLLRSSKSLVMGVHVYHPVKSTAERNPCWSSRCSHLCLLTPNGGYSCACPAGYSVDSDGKTCLPVRSAPFLLAAEENHIWHIHPESVGEDIVTELPLGKVVTIGDVAFDWSTNTIYLSDVHKGAIFALNTTTYRIKPFISKSLDAVESMDFDWLGHNLYWVDAGTGLVEVASTRKDSTRTTLISNLVRPMGLALFLEKGTMYIVSTGDTPVVTECDMDGNNCKSIVSANLGVPVSVAVDPSLGRVFWSDAKLGTIESTDLKGENRLKNKIRVGQVMSVASSESSLFWTDTDRHQIHMTHHEASLGVVGFIKLPHDHNGTAIIKISYFAPPPSRKMGPCATVNGGCSHLCLTTPSGFSCRCPTGYSLGSNRRLCIESPVAVQCDPNEFRCTNTSECIPKSFRCDDREDCKDGSDEHNCTQSCPVGDFRCDSGKCIMESWRCDGYNDCENGADEKNCTRKDTCKSTEFSCNDGHCLSNLWKCDGENDCKGGEDELDCDIHDCDKEEFACKNGACIPKGWACDGDFDCKDKSDELDCSEKSSTCSPGEMRCGDGMCLDRNLLCDRRKDCEDGSDETECEYEIETCSSDEFACNDHTCIFSYEKCDGFKDCSKGEDEAHCSNKCKSMEFHCRQSDRCIPEIWTCDGMDDCGDAEDESLPRCDKTSTTKRPTNNGCPEFTCASGHCISWNKVCDDIPDCYDSSDEGRHCGSTCDIDNGGCSQKCRDSPRGSVCSCLEGFRLLRDSKTCEDINECLVVGHCSQKCTNTKGSFKCDCVDGYKVTADGRRCKAKDGLAQLLYLLPEEIVSLTTEGHKKKMLMKDMDIEMRSLDFDANDSTMFWTERSGSIKAMSNKSVITELATSLGRPHLIAYDWIAKNIYFTTLTSIDVCRRDGLFCGDILKLDTFAQGLALAPFEGLLFWSTSYDDVHGTPGQIFRAPMDGGNGVGKPLSTRVDWPTSLTVDPVSRRLYWTDIKLHTLDVADLDGYNRETLVSRSSDHPSGLTVFEDYIFWSDWSTRRITRANKFTGSSPFHVAYIDAHPSSLKIMHPVVQPKGINPCAKATCPHLCVLKETGYSCKCAYGYLLWNGSRSCVPASKVDVHSGKLVPTHNCTPKSCQNGGVCVETKEGNVLCRCPSKFNGPKCEIELPLDDSTPPDYTLVAAIILGSLAVLIVVIIGILVCKKYSRKIRVFGETIHVTFPNPLFDLLPKSGRLVVDHEELGDDSSTTSKTSLRKSQSKAHKSSTYVSNKGGPMSELYRSCSSDSVDSTFVNDNKENMEKTLISASHNPVRYMKRL